MKDELVGPPLEELIGVLDNKYEGDDSFRLVSKLMDHYNQQLNPHKAFAAVKQFLSNLHS